MTTRCSKDHKNSRREGTQMAQEANKGFGKVDEIAPCLCWAWIVINLDVRDSDEEGREGGKMLTQQLGGGTSETGRQGKREIEL
eukprot:3768189-Rhodomonas_salina.1